MTRILSGIQPSGQFHIGNYFGMMKPMLEYQDRHELFCFIANYHAMTSTNDGDQLKSYTIEAAIDFLALGLDPDKTHFWIQSHVPEVTELTWILANHTTVGLLERSHSYKDKIAKGLTPNAGLFTYPVLMAADILLYKSEIIPVGKDQKQHVEITRDIAEKFNNHYGDIFVLPEPQISKEVSVIPGIDGQKMSKSYGNTISIFEEEKALKKKVMKIVTDSTPVEESKDPDKCNVFALYKLFADKTQLENLRDKYTSGGTGYGDIKKELLALIWDFFKPYREQRAAYQNDIGEVINIMKKGAEKTRSIARETLEQVKKVSGISF